MQNNAGSFAIGPTVFCSRCWMVLSEELTGRQSGQTPKTVQDEPPRKAMGISKRSRLDYLGCHHQHRVQAVTSKASEDIQ